MKTIKIAFLLLVIASQSISAFELNVDTSYSVKRISYPHNVIAIPMKNRAIISLGAI